MLLLQSALLALLGLGFIAAVIIAISTQHPAAIVTAGVLAFILTVTLFFLFIWPAASQAIWPPAAEAAPYVAAPPAATLAPAAAGTCSKDALTASHDDNLTSGRYEMSYFGGTSEACYMFGEFNFGHARQTWLVIVPPNWTFNLAGFIGETMWYRESQGALDWSIKDSTANLMRADGRNEKTPIVVWVNDPTSLKLLPAEAKYEVIPPALP